MSSKSTVVTVEQPKRPVRLWQRSGLRKASVVLLIVLCITTLIISYLWSRPPAVFDVSVNALTLAGDDADRLVPGYATTGAVITVARTLLDKRGGYMSNDIAPPTVFLDNIKNWEYGVLLELRDVVRALRNDFSRWLTQSAENADLATADAQFHFDGSHWILPSTEDEYRKGIAALEAYLDDLAANQTRFYVRADNLNVYLATVEKRLGNLAQRLSENVRDPILRDLLVEGDREISATSHSTPWMEIDDIFFEARGYVWAVLHILKGIEIDFAEQLADKNADLTLRRIIEKLENTQQALWSPVTLNSSGFGLFTNHSLVITSYISRANAALIDLRLLLTQN